MKKQTKPIQRAACVILLACISTLPIFLYAYGKGQQGKSTTVSAGDALQGDAGGGDFEALPKEEAVAMPDVVGMGVEEAAAALSEAGLLYEIDWAEDEGKEGMVILSQGAKPGTELPYKAWVTLTANGIDTEEAQEGIYYGNQAQMPFVYGKGLEEAILAISEAGLEIGNIENVYDWDETIFEAGQVFKTDPASGEPAEKGAKVNLSICVPGTQNME